MVNIISFVPPPPLVPPPVIPGDSFKPRDALPRLYPPPPLEPLNFDDIMDEMFKDRGGDLPGGSTFPETEKKMKIQVSWSGEIYAYGQAYPPDTGVITVSGKEYLKWNGRTWHTGILKGFDVEQIVGGYSAYGVKTVGIRVKAKIYNPNFSLNDGIKEPWLYETRKSRYNEYWYPTENFDFGEGYEKTFKVTGINIQYDDGTSQNFDGIPPPTQPEGDIEPSNSPPPSKTPEPFPEPEPPPTLEEPTPEPKREPEPPPTEPPFKEPDDDDDYRPPPITLGDPKRPFDARPPINLDRGGDKGKRKPPPLPPPTTFKDPDEKPKYADDFSDRKLDLGKTPDTLQRDKKDDETIEQEQKRTQTEEKIDDQFRLDNRTLDEPTIEQDVDSDTNSDTELGQENDKPDNKTTDKTISQKQPDNELKPGNDINNKPDDEDLSDKDKPPDTPREGIDLEKNKGKTKKKKERKVGFPFFSFPFPEGLDEDEPDVETPPPIEDPPPEPDNCEECIEDFMQTICSEPCIQEMLLKIRENHTRIERLEDELLSTIQESNDTSDCAEGKTAVFPRSGIAFDAIDQGIGNLHDHLNFIQENILCKSKEDVIAAIPEWWQVRTGADRKQVVFQFAQIREDGKLDIPNKPISVPWIQNDSIYNWNDSPCPISPHTRGNWEAIATLEDNSKIIVHCNTKKESEKIINEALELITPNLKDNAYIKIGQRKGKLIQEVRVAGKIAKLFKTGQRNTKPDELVYFSFNDS